MPRSFWFCWRAYSNAIDWTVMHTATCCRAALCARREWCSACFTSQVFPAPASATIVNRRLLSVRCADSWLSTSASRLTSVRPGKSTLAVHGCGCDVVCACMAMLTACSMTFILVPVIPSTTVLFSSSMLLV